MHKTELEYWLTERLTRQFFHRVNELRQITSNYITSGEILNDPLFGTKYAKLLGKLEAFKEIEDMEIMFNIEETNEEKNN